MSFQIYQMSWKKLENLKPQAYITTFLARTYPYMFRIPLILFEKLHPLALSASQIHQPHADCSQASGRDYSSTNNGTQLKSNCFSLQKRKHSIHIKSRYSCSIKLNRKYLAIESWTYGHVPIRFHCLAMTTASLPQGAVKLNHIGATSFGMEPINVLHHINTIRGKQTNNQKRYMPSCNLKQEANDTL